MCELRNFMSSEYSFLTKWGNGERSAQQTPREMANMTQGGQGSRELRQGQQQYLGKMFERVCLGEHLRRGNLMESM